MKEVAARRLSVVLYFLVALSPNPRSADESQSRLLKKLKYSFSSLSLLEGGHNISAPVTVPVQATAFTHTDYLMSLRNIGSDRQRPWQGGCCYWRIEEEP